MNMKWGSKQIKNLIKMKLHQSIKSAMFYITTAAA